jgi:hypothetical protein
MGWLQALPIMSQSAISMAATAHMWICAPSVYTSRTRRCEMVSTWNGSIPITSGFNSWMAVSTVLPKLFTVPSPTPWMPSFVDTLANTQFFQGLPAMYVSMAVILMWWRS